MNVNASRKRRSSNARVLLLAVVFILLGSTGYSQVSGRVRKTRRSRQQASAGQLMALSADGTHLVNTFTNQPVFITGEDGWALITELSDADAQTYLADRAGRGFNAIWVAAADNIYQTNAPQNFYGNVPFDGADFTNEDATYWAHVDYVVQQAQASGITLMIDPAFPGLSSSQGYVQSYLNSSDAVVTAYGTFLGNRYKGYSNIVWLLGGDADTPNDSGLQTKLSDLATGIAAADPNHLISYEACPVATCGTGSNSSLDIWTGPPSWLGLNADYTQYGQAQAQCAVQYSKSPFLPPFQIEDWYEGEHSMTEFQLREEAYWEVLSGCYLGRVFGNDAIWTMGGPYDTMGATWQSQLDSPGSLAQEYLGQLFRSREHWLMVPDTNNTVLTAGYGSGTTLSVAARASDGKTIIAYIPNGNATTVTVDMSKITSQSQQAICWWFNPSSGAATLIGVFVNAGDRNFTAPDSNDWVLTIDDASAVSVQLSPPSITLQQSRSQTFTATVIGTTNTAVTWSILPQVGTLTPNGQSALYTAPAVITSQQAVTITATSVEDNAKSGSAAITLIPPGAAPVITSQNTASGTVGIAFSYQITATNNPTSYGAAPLPGGLSVNTATGLISGTAATPGTTQVTLSATNAAGTGTEILTLTINSTSYFVQAVASASPGAAKSLSLSFPANTAAGDLILAAFDFDTTTTPSPVTDSQGNVFTQVGNQLTSPGGTRSQVYYAKSIKGGADTVTVNLSATSSWIELYLTEYSGMDPVNPIDAQAGASGNAGLVSSGNATTTVAGDVIFGYCVGDWTCSAGSGFAARSTFNGNLIEDMMAGNPGAYAARGSANNGWSMQMVALKPATINPPAPVITSQNTASGTVGIAFSYQITATNNPTSYGAAPLPGGLSVNTATGLISGTPTTPGTTQVTLSATNAAGTGTEILTLTINSTSYFVQAVASASPGAAKSLSLSFPANTVAGDLILAAFDFDTTTTPSSVTDSHGNVFTQVGNQLTSPGGTRSQVYYAKSIKGGADTVTVNLSATSSWIELYLTEYSGMDPVNPIDAQAGASGNAGLVSSGNATTTVAGDVIFGYCVGDWTCSAGSGFAARSTFNGNLIEDMMAGNPGAYAARGSANNGWSMQMVALKPAIH